MSGRCSLCDEPIRWPWFAGRTYRVTASRYEHDDCLVRLGLTAIGSVERKLIGVDKRQDKP